MGVTDDDGRGMDKIKLLFSGADEPAEEPGTLQRPASFADSLPSFKSWLPGLEAGKDAGSASDAAGSSSAPGGWQSLKTKLGMQPAAPPEPTGIAAVSAAASAHLSKFKAYVSNAVEEQAPSIAVVAHTHSSEPGFVEEMGENFRLNRKQRLYGFGICFGLGFFFSMLSMMFLMFPIKFATLYTFGNVMFLVSTGFLVGPWNQIKFMFKQNRFIASSIYLFSMFLTLFCALYLEFMLLTLICIVVQTGALLWYCLSYIPFARRLVANLVNKCIGD
eukprot:jgi/Mesvir1/2138/Mv16660-RA.1